MLKWIVIGAVILVVAAFFGTMLLARGWVYRNKKWFGWGFLILVALGCLLAAEKYLFPALAEAAHDEPEPLQWMMLHPVWTVLILLVAGGLAWSALRLTTRPAAGGPGGATTPEYDFWTWPKFWGLVISGYALFILLRYGDAEIWFTWLAQPPSWPDIGIWLQQHWLAVVIGTLALSAGLILLVSDKEWTPIIRKATLGTAILAVVGAFVWHLQSRVTNTCTMPYRLGVVYLCTLTDSWTPALPTEGSAFPADAKFCFSYDSRRKAPQWEKLLTDANTFRWRSEDGPITFYYGLIRTGTCPTDLSKYPHVVAG